MSRETMICCDKYLIGKMSHHLSYEDLVLANGIANSMRSFSYGGMEIRFPCGRWNVDFRNLLESMHIAWQNRTVSDLLRSTCFDRFIVLAPKEFLEDFQKLKTDVTQIAVVYSAFQITECDGQQIRLQLSGGDGGEKITLPIYQLKVLENLSAVPGGNGLKIVEIAEKQSYISREMIRKNMVDSLQNCLIDREYEKEGCHCISGPAFYDLFEKSIYDLYEMGGSQAVSRVRRHIFISSLNTGGEAFFRGAFFYWSMKRQLRANRNSKKYSERMELLVALWNELCRKMRFWETGDFAGDKVQELVVLIRKIRKLEPETVQFLTDREVGRNDL